MESQISECGDPAEPGTATKTHESHSKHTDNVDAHSTEKLDSRLSEEPTVRTELEREHSGSKSVDLTNGGRSTTENRLSQQLSSGVHSKSLDKQNSLSLDTIKSKSIDRLHKHLSSSKSKSVDRYYCQTFETQKSKSLDQHLSHKESLKSKFFDRQHSQPLEVHRNKSVENCENLSTIDRQNSETRPDRKLSDRQNAKVERSDSRCSSGGSSPRWAHRSSSESRSACSSPACHSPRHLTPDRHESYNGSISEDSDYLEEETEKQLVPGVSVRAATIDKLVTLAVDCFGRLLLFC